MYFLESRGPNNTKILSQPIVLLGCREKRRWGYNCNLKLNGRKAFRVPLLLMLSALYSRRVRPIHACVEASKLIKSVCYVGKNLA